MLLMKEAMDAILPPPPRFQDFPERPRGHNVRPGAILDLEAMAEEEQMGPEVMDGGALQEQVDALEGDSAAQVDERVVDEPQTGDDGGDDDEVEDVVMPKSQEDAEDDVEGGIRQERSASAMLSEDKTTPGSSPLLSGKKKKKDTVSKASSVSSSSSNSGSSNEFGPNYYTVVIDRNTKMESVQILLKDEVFNLRVKACSDAYVLYKQTKAADEFSYHIGLGYGRKTVIWKQPPDPVTKEFMTPEEGILNCNQFVTYWIKWSAAKFFIGVGGRAEPYLEWKDPKAFTIGAVSLATPHPKQKVTWHLDTKSSKLKLGHRGK
jgi:hypothetical protein